jgi:hypothetical protein
MLVRLYVLSALFVISASLLAACSSGFQCGPGQQPVCQSGPKYGTQCYCVQSPSH